MLSDEWTTHPISDGKNYLRQRFSRTYESSTRNKLAVIIAAVFLGCLAAVCPANESISYISPDGRFAVCWSAGSGEGLTARLIALPARTEAMPLANWTDDLVWAPDSRRFAREVEEGAHYFTVTIYERAGESFKTVARIDDFPGSGSAYKGWPKGWRDTGRDQQVIYPIRWLDGETLLLGVHRSVRVQKGEESKFWMLEAQFTAKLGTKGKVTKSALTVVSRGFDETSPPNFGKKPPPKLVSDHIKEPTRWLMSPNNTVAMVEGEGVLDVIERRRGEPARVMHLRERIDELFLPDFRDCGAEPLDAKRPFKVESDWFFPGAGRVAIWAEATTNPNGDQRSKMWCARFDAIWSIKQAKFLEQKVVRGFCGKVSEDDGARVAARSPSGAFRIELREKLDAKRRSTGEFKAFIVPENGGEPAALDQTIRADEAPSLTCHISPDERWIYAEWGSSQSSHRTLFARGEGFHFARVLPPDPADGTDGFEKAMWDFCKTTAGFELRSRRDCTFIAWAPDSSRLLLSLQVDANGLERQWKAYWNTRTRAFELTPFLTELNTQARDVSVWTLDRTVRPYCAEPEDALPPLDQLDRELAAARAAFDENWKNCAANEKERIKKESAKSWPEIEKNTEAWRAEAIADIEKAAAEFSLRWPEPEREQWRRLSLAGGFRALEKRISNEWPWR